jgi:probable F420-dependent oxidoreductase
MRYMAVLPFAATRDPVGWCDGRPLADWAAAAESAGFDAVAVTDHPFPSDSWMATGGHHAFDPFVVLTAFAAATTRVRVVTDVLVAGYRSPYMVAKSMASLDVISGGRLTLGMGAGYQQAEFDALGASFADRGRRFDEAIEAIGAALTGTSVVRNGGYYPASGNTMLPCTIQKPRPPIWIGGNAEAAMRRAARLADGWMPFHQTKERVSISRSPSLESLDELAERIERVQALRAEMGGAPLDICASPFEPRLDPETFVRHAHAYGEAGVTWMRAQAIGGSTLEDSIERLQRWREALQP